MTNHPAYRAFVGAVGICVATLFSSTEAHAEPRTFGPGSLIIPMDLSYQDRGTFQAFGLLFQLARQGVPVAWVIEPTKTYHPAPCNTVGDNCAWDCAIEGSGVKCPYPTASPDFFAAATVLWSDAGTTAGTVVSNHGYRGGPFVIDSAHRDAALAIINAWNDPALWAANPWAGRTISEVVTVHEATAAFTGHVSRDVVAAPTIAVFSDGNEDIATGYLRAAGIKQSNGTEFPAARCNNGTCGPGTINPDMLTVASVAGDMGTCDVPNFDHKNGALFTADGVPAYCQIMSMHWGVADRETVECGGQACPDTQAQCAPGTPITYHGHEVVAEVRAFLNYPTHFFAECQAVNAYENTTVNPNWPFLDDDGRDGHFLTTKGNPPPCPCTAPGYSCVAGGCNGTDCCLANDIKERGAGFEIGARPADYRVFNPHVPYNQFDGAFATVGGSEPSYNLSTYLGTTYKNDRQVTFLSGPDGPGIQDIWMTGYLDGNCDIIDPIERTGVSNATTAGPPPTCGGKVSYLGGHQYDDAIPLSGNPAGQGARYFLNALFEADCVTDTGQPALSINLAPTAIGANSLPHQADLAFSFANNGPAAALDAVLQQTLGGGAAIVAAVDGTVTGNDASWSVGSVGGSPANPGDPASTGQRTLRVSFPSHGEYTVTARMTYRVGVSNLRTVDQTFVVRVLADGDGDGVPDDNDPFPDNPSRCGSQDGDDCDDCASGSFDPRNDGPDANGDGLCDAGSGDGSSGCCHTGGALPLASLGFIALIGYRLRRRR